MGDLHEIVSIEATERLFVMLAVALPLCGILVGVVLGAWQKKPLRYSLIGLLAGMIGPLNWLMWRVFNMLTQRNGLDTVQNVFVNLAVFVCVGVGIGLGFGFWLRRAQAAPKVGIRASTDAAEAPQSQSPAI